MITSEICKPNAVTTSVERCGNEACKKNYSTLLKCSRCKSKLYCGTECQKADWHQHRHFCKPEKPKIVDTEKPISGTSMIEVKTPIPGLRLIKNFIPDQLHDRFVQEMHKGTPELNKGHYDGYSFDDNEAFDAVFDRLIEDVFSKLRTLDLFSEEKKPLKLACTLIGYEKDGFISRHVDSPLLGGATVVVMSFNSPVVLNFYSEKKVEKQQHKIFIPPKSVYSMTGEARYEWSHAILKDESSYDSKEFTRGVRYAILLTPPGPLYSGSELLDFN